jgi:hypothetical protein
VAEEQTIFHRSVRDSHSGFPHLVFGKSLELLVRNTSGVSQKSRVFALRIMSFHKNWKLCDLMRSLSSAKVFPFQVNVRYSPYARSSNGETVFSVK